MTTNDNDELTNTAMNIILASGNARNFCDEAIKLAKMGCYEDAEKKMKIAKDNLLKAHKEQTEVIQRSAEGEIPNLTLLFIHALDTLMTIKSEVTVRGDIIELYKFQSK